MIDSKKKESGSYKVVPSLFDFVDKSEVEWSKREFTKGGSKFAYVVVNPIGVPKFVKR